MLAAHATHAIYRCCYFHGPRWYAVWDARAWRAAGDRIWATMIALLHKIPLRCNGPRRLPAPPLSSATWFICSRFHRAAKSVERLQMISRGSIDAAETGFFGLISFLFFSVSVASPPIYYISFRLVKRMLMLLFASPSFDYRWHAMISAASELAYMI